MSLQDTAHWEMRVGAVPSVLSGMQDRAGPLAAEGAWVVAGGWRSFKADFVQIHKEGSSVALKFGDNWSTDDPQFIASEIERVRSLLRDLPGGGVRMPAALGWCDDPPALAIEVVTGRRLFDLIRTGDDRDRVADLVTRSGRAIGAYHRAQPAPPDVAAALAAAADLDTAARRVLVRGSRLDPMKTDLARARGYRFSPNDFLVDDEGSLVLLDPPHVQKYDYVHRDLGAFCYELHRACVGEKPGKGASLASRDALREAFLAGYVEATAGGASGPADVWVMDVYSLARASVLAYNRARSGKVDGALRAARWTLAWRARLGSPPPSARRS